MDTYKLTIASGSMGDPSDRAGPGRGARPKSYKLRKDVDKLTREVDILKKLNLKS